MTKKTSAAFTLIELLVVISIIARSGRYRAARFYQCQERGTQNQRLSNAKQIGLA